MWRFVFLLAGVVHGGHVSPTRVKRGIFGTITSTVYETMQEKHYVPASCVHVAPHLPDCRNLRFMNYPSFDSDSFKFFNIPNDLFPTAAQSITKLDITKRIDQNAPLTNKTQGWGEYLGFYRPTVTITELKIEPTTVFDPRIMVTYDIRGCKPHELPYKMEKCVEDNSLELAEIVPTTTVHTDIKATKRPDDVHGSEPEGL